MKSVLFASFTLALFADLAASCGADCACETKASACCAASLPPGTVDEALPGHPLRGVVLDVVPEKKSLLVRHEEIPGVMAAMTMLLRVDEVTLASARKDQAIVARLTREDGVWWIRQVRPVAPPASP